MTLESANGNIGPAQRRRRARLGLLSLAVAIPTVIAPYALGLDPGLRFVSLPLVLGGFLGLLQHRDGT